MISVDYIINALEYFKVGLPFFCTLYCICETFFKRNLFVQGPRDKEFAIRASKIMFLNGRSGTMFLTVFEI